MFPKCVHQAITQVVTGVPYLVLGDIDFAAPYLYQ